MGDFRAFQPCDTEGVIAVFRSNIPKYFTADEEAGLRAFLADYDSHGYYVLERNGEIVSAGGIALDDDQTVSLCWGMVRQDLLSTGMGRELTQFRIQLSRERYGDKPMVITTSQHTSGFYEKFGFVMVEHIIDGYSPGIDECKMRLEAAQ